MSTKKHHRYHKDVQYVVLERGDGENVAHVFDDMKEALALAGALSINDGHATLDVYVSSRAGAIAYDGGEDWDHYVADVDNGYAGKEGVYRRYELYGHYRGSA